MSQTKRRTARASLLFFFQAEDGIRDLTVTGVQTCALPISLLAPRLTVAADGRALAPQWVGLETISERQSLRLRLRFALRAPPGTVEVTTRRSEERRVGKEGRSRWSPYH